MNYATKEKALFNRTQIDKMLSNKATEKSLANGFTISQHNQAALHIVELYRNAKALPPRQDREGDPNVESIRIFVAPVVTIKGGAQADAVVYITVKRAAQQHKSEQTRNRIYSLELLDMELRHVDRGGRLANNQALSRPQPTDTIANPDADVKPQPGLITIPPANTALSVGDLHTGARVAYGKPDSRFIGSGEGAHVYGWGHYSSGVKGVARDEYAMRYVKEYQDRRRAQYKGTPRSSVSLGGITYDSVADFANEASRIEEVIHDKLLDRERIEQDKDGNFIVGDKTVPKELLVFIAATRATFVDASNVFDAWAGKAVPADYRDPEFYRLARDRAKSQKDSVLPLSQFYGEMMLRGPLKSKKAWSTFVDTFFPKMEQVLPEGPLPAVMRQTWWTHRPEGDESHLLDWYGPLSDENWSRVVETLEDLMAEYDVKPYEMDAVFGRNWREPKSNGESAYIMVTDFFQHMMESDYPEKDASEALYAHDIDGVKYPVDAYSNDDNRDGGLGWNYVAFSDEHLRVDSVEEWNPETRRFEPRPVPGNTALSVGEPVEVPSASLEEAQAAIRTLAQNHATIKMRNGDVLQFSAQSNKMHNSKAVHESDNAEAHFAAVAAIKQICETAEFIYDEPPRNNSSDILYYRKYAAPVVVNGQGYIAKLTAKVYPQKGSNNVAYSIEAISLERVGDRGINDAITKGRQHLDPIAIKKVTHLVNLVKDYLGRGSGETRTPGNTALSVGGFGLNANARAEMEEVRRRYEGTEQWMKAPNGKRTNLNERQWLQVRTPSFKAWFGDWENDPANASKVVDENGEPLVVYHGTDEEFWVFQTYDETGIENRFHEMPSRSYMFTPDEFGAMEYGRPMPTFLNIRRLADFSSKEALLTLISRREKDIDEVSSVFSSGGDLEPFIADDGRLFSEHPSNADDLEADDAWRTIQEMMERETRELGYEGYLFNDSSRGEEHQSFGVADNANIKSATDNVGTFDPANPDIRLSVGSRMGRWESEPAPVVEPGGDVREAGEGALAWLRRKFVHSQTPVFDAVRRVMGVGREPPDALNVEAAGLRRGAAGDGRGAGATGRAERGGGGEERARQDPGAAGAAAAGVSGAAEADSGAARDGQEAV